MMLDAVFEPQETLGAKRHPDDPVRFESGTPQCGARGAVPGEDGKAGLREQDVGGASPTDP